MVTAAGEQIVGAGGGLLAGLAFATALMIVIRMRYPRWWFDFARELTRFGARVGAYVALLAGPISVHCRGAIGAPRDRVSRGRSRPEPLAFHLVKWFLAIPHPWNYIEGQGLERDGHDYPQLVQYSYDKEGFRSSATGRRSGRRPTAARLDVPARPGTKWSDGQADDGERRRMDDQHDRQVPRRADRGLAACAHHAKGATRTDATTLVIHYTAPVGNALAQLEQFCGPAAARLGAAGRRGREGPEDLSPRAEPADGHGGAYTVKQYEKKGTTVFIPDPDFYGPKSHADAVALTYYTNADSMIADLEHGDLDWVDQVPFKAINVVKKRHGRVAGQGRRRRDDEHHVELEPAQAEEPRAPRPAGQAGALDVRRSPPDDPGRLPGLRLKVESLVGHISPLENPNLGPLEYDCAAANTLLDELGYKRGSDGIRIVRRRRASTRRAPIRCATTS